MALKLKQRYCDRKTLLQILGEMAAKIAEDEQTSQQTVFIGILQGGAPIADYLAKQVSAKLGYHLPVAYLDISLYRDDTIDSERDPFSRKCEIPFAVKNKRIILTDDVLFTGRTVRAALTSILYFGRPNVIRLASVVDRGFRELPIHPDYVGCYIETTKKQGVRVRVQVPHEQQGIYIMEETSP